MGSDRCIDYGVVDAQLAAHVGKPSPVGPGPLQVRVGSASLDAHKFSDHKMVCCYLPWEVVQEAGFVAKATQPLQKPEAVTWPAWSQALEEAWETVCLPEHRSVEESWQWFNSTAEAAQRRALEQCGHAVAFKNEFRKKGTFLSFRMIAIFRVPKRLKGTASFAVSASG